jgi:hypothetical protein
MSLAIYQGKQIAVDLSSGASLSGTVLEIGQQGIRLETSQGICVIFMSAVQTIWEKGTEPAMETLAAQKDKNPEAEQICRQTYSLPCTMNFTGYPGGGYPGGTPCTQAYSSYGQCPRRFTAPCYASYTQAEQDPCYRRFGFGRPCYAVFGGLPLPLPYPYPYPPYYPPYQPYPPYPYPPFPYNEGEGLAEQESQK